MSRDFIFGMLVGAGLGIALVELVSQTLGYILYRREKKRRIDCHQDIKKIAEVILSEWDFEIPEATKEGDILDDL